MTYLLIGHSLGASRVNVQAARAVFSAKPPAGVFKFGEPHTGFGKFNDLLRQIPQGVSPSYRNADTHGHDRVTDLPPKIEPAFPYAHPWPLIDVSQSPDPNDKDIVFNYHHAQLYRSALLKLNPVLSISGVTAIQAINLVIGLYAYPGEPPVTWDHLDLGHDDGVVWAMKIISGVKCFVFRGSQTVGDFVKDGQAAWWYDRDIGPVEIGFLLGSHSVWEEMQPMIVV